MIAAIWKADRAYCGQQGCRNRSALTRSARQGRVSIGNRWVLDETISPSRWRHASKPVFTVAPSASISTAGTRAMRAAIRESPAAREADIPQVFVCPVCGVPNRVDNP
jgi:hypothetical protein